MGDEGNTKIIGSVEGEFNLPEISSDILDDGDQWEIECRITSGDEALVKSL